MTYDYFYGQQAEMFTFYRVPKVLFTEDCFWNVSTDAKLLYGILLDRMNLSARNGWLDEEGRVYIIFTIEEIKGALGCAEKKAVKLLDELEKKCGLIERKRQGLGKPNLIYVKNFISGSVERQLLDQRACLIISDVEQAVLDEIKTTYETELWLMEDMNFAIVRCVSMLIGSDDTGYVTEYRAFKKILKSAEDLFFSPEELIEELESMCVPQWEHEATIYEL